MKRILNLSIIALLMFHFSAFPQAALEFDGIDDFIQSNYPGISGNNPHTVMAWIKTTANSDPNNGGLEKTICDWGTISNGGRFTFAMLYNDAIRIEVHGGGLNGTIPVNDGIWHLVAVTYDRASPDNFRLFVDGNLDISGNVSPAVNTIPSISFRIGMCIDDVRSFEGEIDEVSIWDKALTQQEIIQNSCIPGDLSQIENLISYYDFNEGEGDIVTDLKGNYNGILLNMNEDDWVDSDVCLRFWAKFIVSDFETGNFIENATVILDEVLQQTNEFGETIFFDYLPGTYAYFVFNDDYTIVNDSVVIIDEDQTIEISLLVTSIASNPVNDIRIYPNPSDGIVNVDFGSIVTESTTFSLLNQSGQIIQTFNSDINKLSLNLTGIPKGYYLIKALSGKGAFTSPLIIK